MSDTRCSSGECEDSINKECQEEEGGCFDLAERYMTHYYWDYCDNYYSTNAEVTLNVAPNVTENQEWNEIITQKAVWLEAWLSEVPDHMLDESCMHDGDGSSGNSTEEAYSSEPDEVQFAIRHPPASKDDGHSNYNYYSIVKDRHLPKDGSDGSKVTNIAISALASAASWISHPVARAGVAVAQAFVAAASYFNDPVTVEHGFYDSNNVRELVEWKIELDGETSDDFPDSHCNCAAVRFDINAKESNVTSTIETYANYTYWVPQYRENSCVCGYWAPVLHETGYAHQDYEFDQINK